jgi:uncharacterized protein (TIGR02145 family)
LLSIISSKTYIMTYRLFSILSLVFFVFMFASCDKNGDGDENPENTAPNAAFNITPASGGTSTVFQFDASSSNDAEDPVANLQFRWDWDGDGTWDTQYDGSTQAQHTYTDEGNYEAKLEVRDTEGLTGEAIRSVQVSDSGNNPPNAPGDPDPENGETEVQINTNLSWSCIDPDGNPLKYDVYFGIENDPPLVAQDITSTNFDPGALQENTLYYWKILAKDNQGATTQGEVWSFTTLNSTPFVCGEDFTDPRDQQVYPTVQIGQDCWMAKNMNIGDRIDGSTEQTNNQVIEKYCYDDDPANCDAYGGLYQWDELMQFNYTDNQGICPDGWHIPTDVEYMEMEMAIGMPQSEVLKAGLRGTDEGSKLKAGGISGFEGLLGGYQNGEMFSALGSYGTFFSSEDDANLAWCRYLFNDNSQVLRDKYDKSFAFSARCVKDPD